MKEKKKQFIFVLLLGLFLVNYPSISFAADNSNGGQVTTEGIITFYEETVETSSRSKDSETPTEKPTGKLPSTGELIGSVALFSGVMISFFILFFFLKKRKKEEGEPSE